MSRESDLQTKLRWINYTYHGFVDNTNTVNVSQYPNQIQTQRATTTTNQNQTLLTSHLRLPRYDSSDSNVTISDSNSDDQTQVQMRLGLEKHVYTSSLSNDQVNYEQMQSNSRKHSNFNRSSKEWSIFLIYEPPLPSNVIEMNAGMVRDVTDYYDFDLDYGDSDISISPP